MRLGLALRAQVRAVGGAVADQFDQLVAAISSSWNRQHGPDGEHTAITAETIATGRLVFSEITSDTIAASSVNNYAPEIATAAILRLDCETAGIVSLTGLAVPMVGDAVLDGRVLTIENTSAQTTFALEAENTNSLPRNRFWTPGQANALDTSAPARVYLLPTTLTTLIYNATVARWIVMGRHTDSSRVLSFGGSQQDNLAIVNLLSANTVRVSTTAAGGSISGISSVGIPATAGIRLINAGVYAVDLMHMHTGSTADNRITCPSGARYKLHPREAVDLVRAEPGWRLLDRSDQWIDVVFNAGDYTASSGAWTLASGDVTTLAYQINGNRMTISFELVNTTVTATPTTLRIAIPGGRIAARQMTAALGYAKDNGTTLDTGRVGVTAGATVLSIVKNAANTAWATSADLTDVSGQITIMVRDDSAVISETHTDVAHGDTAHQDGDHTDVAHKDTAHSDAHSDTAHSDVAHKDAAHADVTHLDAHTDTHTDTIHSDVNTTPHLQHADSHADVAHSDRPHSDASHQDTAHTDVSHSDSHSDVVHSDTAHVDSSHGDTAHADSVHEDVGYHTDNAHVDV